MRVKLVTSVDPYLLSLTPDWKPGVHYRPRVLVVLLRTAQDGRELKQEVQTTSTL